MKKKYWLIISCLISLLTVFESMNYEPFELKLSVKSLLRQELSLEEMKNSNIYKAYNQITFSTNVDEMNNILNKKSKNICGSIESWYFPYGYVSIWYSEKEKARVMNKIVNFETPYTTNINEKELKSLFEYDSLEEIINMLGEPVLMGAEYNKDGQITDYSYEWGIETKYSKKFIEDMEKQYDDYVRFPFNKQIGKLRLRVSIKANNEIEKFSLDDY